jgi:Protein of unknown function (DUF4007)
MSYNLNFHQTFSPEKDAISQLLKLSRETNKFLTKEEISQMTTIPTGVSSGKVVPNIYYANLMGLINIETKGKGFRLFPTSLGNTVSIEDPYIVESVTLWACHYNLVSKQSRALLWSYIFNDITHQLGTTISKDVLTGIVNKRFEVDVNLTPFRTGYLKGIFSPLNIIREEGKNYIFTPHKIEPSLKYLYAYQLINSWETILTDRTEITINDVQDKLHYGNPYLWEEKQILNILELLQDERIIIINRQLKPLTIVRQESSQELLSKIYSLLI